MSHGTRRAAPTGDALPALIALTVALMGIPAVLIFKPLGAAGTPAQMIGIGLLVWWLASWVATRRAPQRWNPVMLLLLQFVVIIVMSDVFGMSRPLAFGAEIRSADRALLSLAAWSGIVVVTTYGLATYERVQKLLKAVAIGTTFIAVLGVLQFFLKVNLADYIRIPGLSANHEFGRLLARSTFHRISGTTSHPIEFGVVVSSTLPLLVHFARFAPTPRAQRWWWAATLVTASTLPMSVARSAIIGGAITLLYLFHTWPATLKRRALAAIGVGGLAIMVVVPGLLGTIRTLFTGAPNDPSTLGRTADYPVVWHQFLDRPFFGQGFFTYIPSIYRTLDNQYLQTLVGCGLIGLISLLIFFAGNISVAGHIRRKTDSEDVRDLAQSLKAGLAVVAVTAATFDTFSFSMAAGLTFLFVGLIGALWRTTVGETPPPVHSPIQRRKAIATAVVVLLATSGVGAVRAISTQRTYWATATMVLVPKHDAALPAFSTSSAAKVAASIMLDTMTSPRSTTLITRGHHFTYTMALANGSLAAGSDVKGDSSSTLIMAAMASTPDEANLGVQLTVQTTQAALEQLQNSVHADPASQIVAEVVQRNGAYPVTGRPTRAVLDWFLVTLLVGTAVIGHLRARRPRRRLTDDPGHETLEPLTTA